jgi:hypothetical protein
MLPPISTGFDGLSSFATDADAAIASADKIAAAPRPLQTPTPRAGPPSEPVDQDGGALYSGIKKIGGWVIAIALILAIKSCFFAGTRAVVDDVSSPDYDETAQDYSTASDGEDDTTDASGEYMATDGSAAPTNGVESGAGIDTPYDGDSTSDYVPVAAPSEEMMPAPGGATLTMAEMQYCMAEDIRLSAQKSEIESLQGVDSDRFNRNVDDFNAAVRKYNGACSNRQIRASQRPLAEANVNGRRYILESEGRRRVQ